VEIVVFGGKYMIGVSEEEHRQLLKDGIVNLQETDPRGSLVSVPPEGMRELLESAGYRVNRIRRVE
jgi:hypothetical protein